MARGVSKPRSFRAISPLSEPLAHREIAGKLAARLKGGFLQRQRLIENESASACKAAHIPRLLAIWHEFKLEGLQALHGGNCDLDDSTTAEDTFGARTILPRPEGRGLPRNPFKLQQFSNSPETQRLPVHQGRRRRHLQQSYRAFLAQQSKFHGKGQPQHGCKG